MKKKLPISSVFRVVWHSTSRLSWVDISVTTTAKKWYASGVASIFLILNRTSVSNESVDTESPATTNESTFAKTVAPASTLLENWRGTCDHIQSGFLFIEQKIWNVGKYFFASNSFHFVSYVNWVFQKLSVSVSHGLAGRFWLVVFSSYCLH